MYGSLAIIGAGRVARGLGRRLREQGWRVGSVVARSEAAARRTVRFIGAGHPASAISRRLLMSWLILIATPDAAISEVAAELARIGSEELRDKVVLHTSGALGSAALRVLREHGAKVGAIHPLQTFTGVGVPLLEGRVFAIEGDTGAVRAARQIARSVGGIPVQIDGEKRAVYHAAAVFAAGHVLAVVEAATRLMMNAGMRRREAVRALLPLTRQVLENFEHFGARTAWTGPLARGEHAVVALHEKALEEFSPELKDAYEALNRLALRVLTQEAIAKSKTDGNDLSMKKAKAKATGGRE